MQRYNPKDIETKWQKKWQIDSTYQVDTKNTAKPKFYGFAMLPYPSGTGLHTGHVRTYTLADVAVRAKRQQGFNAYNPIGWDAFGLPAENYAIKTGTPPKETIAKATARFREQLSRIGMSYDWSKEINTSDPEYYKWTQWVFTKLHEHGLAYQKESLQWWCSIDKTVLANEQVVNGKCWRHDNPTDPLVTKKSLKQWFFKITDYADELLDATDDLDWPSSIKTMQKNWIGRSKGAEISFAIEGGDSKKVVVFTTRPDTIFGATFMVLAPEHTLIKEITNVNQRRVIDDYVAEAQAKSEIDRMDTGREKTGVFTGSYAINPATDKKIPIWISDYVLMGYGTGAIMAVPAHDERDNEFAKKFELPILRVVKPETEEAILHVGEGVLVNSGIYNGQNSADMREKIVADLAKKGVAEEKVNYKIHDWLISRQRYWGAPIPIIHCAKDGAVAVPEADLPVELPEIKSYQPKGDGTSVLADVDEWVNTTCPKCGGPAKRETDTMDGYACSSWYFLRYLDPHNKEQAWDPEIIKKWMPIDFYNGADHAVSHLLYARFWTRFFFKLGLIGHPEPVKRLVYNAYILATDGTKMSKSKGNVVDPLEVIDSGYGADALRVYEMFIAPYDMEAPWNTKGVPGTYRFLRRIWDLAQVFIEPAGDQSALSGQQEKSILQITHKTIKKVTSDIEVVKYNTAIAAMMEMTNDLQKLKEAGVSGDAWRIALEGITQLLAPFAPHISEELWQLLGHQDSVHIGHWPVWDEQYLVEETVKIVVQINGKLRATLELPTDSDQSAVQKAALEHPRVKEILGDGKPKRIVYVPGRLLNIVS